MNAVACFATLPARYWGWGTMGATPYNFARHAEVIEHVKPMTSPATLALLDHAVRHLEPGECYLEVGTWRGGTLIGALRDNPDACGYAVDNDAMLEHNRDERLSRDVWAEHVAHFGVAARACYIDGAVPEVFARLAIPPVGVYLFDGDKSTDDAAWDGLAGVVPHLAPRAVILLDDGNTPEIRRAAWRFCQAHRAQAYICLDMPTPANGWPSFWNGIMAIAWDGEGR